MCEWLKARFDLKEARVHMHTHAHTHAGTRITAETGAEKIRSRWKLELRCKVKGSAAL